MKVEGNVLIKVSDEDIKDGVFEFPENVTAIGDRAFQKCNNLKSITIPDTVSVIGEYAFCQCLGLESVKVSNGVKTIGEYAFFLCENLQSVSIPESVEHIPEGLFYRCNNLSSVTLANSVKGIGKQAFYRCENLISFTIPEHVDAIHKATFSRCNSLETITIPGNVKTIEEKAFGDCQNLSSVIIPDTVKKIGTEAFSKCGQLKSIFIDTDNEENFEQVKKLLPSSLQKIAFKLKQKEKYQQIKDGAISRFITDNILLLTPLYREIILGTINKENELNRRIPNEIYSHITHFIVNEYPDYQECLNEIDNLEPNYDDSSDKAFQQFEANCKEVIEKHARHIAVKYSMTDDMINTLVNHIISEHGECPKSKECGSLRENECSWWFFKNQPLDIRDSYFLKIKKIAVKKDICPLEKLTDIKEATQDYINQLAKNKSYRYLFDIIKTVNGKEPEKEQLVEMHDKAKRYNIVLNNLQAKLVDLVTQSLDETSSAVILG